MTTALTVGGLRALSVRLLIPWTGAWVAEVDLDPDAASQAPTGQVSIAIGDASPLEGTVDPRGSGTFAATAKLRVVGGGGGWDKPVKPQHWHSAGAGVLSTQVYQATAALVGETVQDLAPVSFGADFVRSAGPASRVFGDRPWWVGLDGVTRAGARPPASAAPSLELLDWDPVTARAEVTADGIVVPGTTLADARLPGPKVVRDVEQTFSHGGGARASCWCSSASAGRLGAALKTLVRELAAIDYLKVYRYRFVEDLSGGLALQAVESVAGFPDAIPAPVWTGMSGVTARLRGATEVLLEFVRGDPAQPIVRGFSTLAIPLELTLDASDGVHVGPSATAVDLAGGGHPIALADKLLSELSRIATAITSLGGSYTPPLSPSAIGSTKGSCG